MVHLLIQNEEECFQVDPSNESVDECDPFAEINPSVIKEEYASGDKMTINDSEETNSHLAVDNGEMDDAMLNVATKIECVRIFV